MRFTSFFVALAVGHSESACATFALSDLGDSRITPFLPFSGLALASPFHEVNARDGSPDLALTDDDGGCFFLLPGSGSERPVFSGTRCKCGEQPDCAHPPLGSRGLAARDLDHGELKPETA